LATKAAGDKNTHLPVKLGRLKPGRFVKKHLNVVFEVGGAPLDHASINPLSLCFVALTIIYDILDSFPSSGGTKTALS
jgi:hypothetical protein